MTNIEEEIANSLSSEFQKQIDFDVFADVMCRFGWTRVDITRFTDNHHAIDMREWTEQNCQHEFKHNGRIWIFASESEAMWFKLKWQH